MKAKIAVILMIIIILFVSGCATTTTSQQATQPKDTDENLEEIFATMDRQEATQRRQEYVNAHPEIDGRTRVAILSGEVFIGMDKGQVIASWGRPHDINRTVGFWGVNEQWVYGYTKYYGSGVSGFIPTHYFYFENGKLTSWQD